MKQRSDIQIVDYDTTIKIVRGRFNSSLSSDDELSQDLSVHMFYKEKYEGSEYYLKMKKGRGVVLGNLQDSSRDETSVPTGVVESVMRLRSGRCFR